MDVRDVTEEYYKWLCNLVRETDTYERLFKSLYGRTFLHSIPNDENRAYEGMQLRGKFCDSIGVNYYPDEFRNGCSMLELVIGLAYNCEYITDDLPGDFEMRDWFWRIISNIRLDLYNDEHFEESKVDVIINKIIDRSYKRNGDGGLFPLKFSKKDQRRVELWYQMNEYLMENYFT